MSHFKFKCIMIEFHMLGNKTNTYQLWSPGTIQKATLQKSLKYKQSDQHQTDQDGGCPSKHEEPA